MIKPIMYAGHNIAGKRCGRLVVKKFANRKNWGLNVKCVCDCGRTVVVRAVNLQRMKSCGCYRDEVREATGFNVKHLYDRRGAVRSEYTVWLNMRKPGRYPESIKVCRKWDGVDGFLNFIGDMGDKPSPHLRLTRIDKGKGFSPKNCKWATY